MKNMYMEQKSIKIIGELEKLDDGTLVCLVKNKDIIQEYKITDILEQMIGTEISLQSVNEIA
jgi:hypothetical protein